jgi:hypothetical protein
MMLKTITTPHWRVLAPRNRRNMTVAALLDLYEKHADGALSVMCQRDGSSGLHVPQTGSVPEWLQAWLNQSHREIVEYISEHRGRIVPTDNPNIGHRVKDIRSPEDAKIEAALAQARLHAAAPRAKRRPSLLTLWTRLLFLREWLVEGEDGPEPLWRFGRARRQCRALEHEIAVIDARTAAELRIKLDFISLHLEVTTDASVRLALMTATTTANRLSAKPKKIQQEELRHAA